MNKELNLIKQYDELLDQYTLKGSFHSSKFILGILKRKVFESIILAHSKGYETIKYNLKDVYEDVSKLQPKINFFVDSQLN